MTVARPRCDVEGGRDIAARLEEENPRWMVVFGFFTQEFVCFPRFNAPKGTMLIETNPRALPSRMRDVENSYGE